MNLSFSTNLLNFSNLLFGEAEEMMTDSESVIIGLYQTIKDLLVRCQYLEDTNDSLEIELVQKDKRVSEITKELTVKNAQLLDSRTQIKVLHKQNKDLEGKVEKLVKVIDILRKATSGEVEFDELNVFIDTKTSKTKKERDSEVLDDNMFDKTGDSCDDLFTTNQYHHNSKVTGKSRGRSISTKSTHLQKHIVYDNNIKNNLLTTTEVNQNVTDIKVHVDNINPTIKSNDISSIYSPVHQIPKTKVRRSLSETTVYSCKQKNILTINKELGISGIDERSVTPLNPTTIKSFWANDIHDIPCRSHYFEKYSLSMGYCDYCKAFVIRSKNMFKCKDCRIVCHLECIDKAPKPCIPKDGLYKNVTKNKFYLSDICPRRFPFIPFIVIHCVIILEKFYLTSEGLYRIPGVESNVTKLYNAFFYSKSLPTFKDVEPETITGCLKKFLNELRAPVIPKSSWFEFVSAVRKKDNDALTYAISDLPAPNLHTLSYLCIHWLKVTEHSQQNKMSSENIAKIVGPTIVGFSKTPGMLTEAQIENETESQYLVMLAFLQLSKCYWMQFLTKKISNGRSKTPIEVMNTLRRKQIYQKTKYTDEQNSVVLSPLVSTLLH